METRNLLAAVQISLVEGVLIDGDLAVDFPPHIG